MSARPRILALPAGPAFLGVLSGLVLVVAIFMPWYEANLGEPASPGSASGWEATAVAKGAFGLAVLWILASALLLADHADLFRVDSRTAEALGWLIAGCALLAGGLIAYRLFKPPEPADFLTRDVGLFFAIAAAAIGVAAGFAQAARR